MAMTIELMEHNSRRDDRRGLALIARDTHRARCHGFMVAEQGFESLLDSDAAATSSRRCVQCGDVIDPVILQHRRLQRATELSRSYG